jgi:hypothetical protein
MPEIRREGITTVASIADRIDALDGYGIYAGWDRSAVYENGTPVAQVMAWQEFGVAARSIPARPFMRPAVAEDKSKWDGGLLALSKRVIEGKTTVKSAFDAVGLMMESSIVDSIVRVTSPPLSPVTLMLRKFKKQGREITGAVVGEAARLVKEGKADYSGVSTKPLNDTGFALSTLTHVVAKE